MYVLCIIKMAFIFRRRIGEREGGRRREEREGREHGEDVEGEVSLEARQAEVGPQLTKLFGARLELREAV